MPANRPDDNATYVASASGSAHQVTVANGATKSDAADLGNRRLGRVSIPAEADGTSMSFEVGNADGSAFQPLYKDDGSLYSVTIAASRDVAVDLSLFATARFVKVVMGTAQTGPTVVTLHTLS